MKKILAVSAASLFSFGVFAAPSVDNQHAANITATGDVVSYISITGITNLTFPDLVIPRAGADDNTVVLATNGDVTFNGASSPEHGTDAGTANGLASTTVGAAQVTGQDGYKYSLSAGAASCEDAGGNSLTNKVSFTPTISSIDANSQATIANGGLTHSIGGTITATNTATATAYTCTFTLTASYVGNLN